MVKNKPAEQKKYYVFELEDTAKAFLPLGVELNLCRLIKPRDPAPRKSVAGSLT